MAPNCTVSPDAVPSDAGIAGIGVLLSFIITAIVALALSASLIFQEFRSDTNTNPNKPSSSSSSSSTLRRKLLSSYSDQQILTGIGIQSVGLAKVDTLVPYHFFVVWMLSLLSIAVHNATLLALVRDYRRDWVLRWLRQFLMFVSLALSCVSGIFVLQAVRRGLTDDNYPVACVWVSKLGGNGESENKPASDAALSYAGTIAVIAGNVVVFVLATWYLHMRTRQRRRLYRATQLAGLVLMTCTAVGAAIRVAVLADAFRGPGTSPRDVGLSDAGERQWSFGQLLSVGMLVLPLVSLVEILRGEIRCAPPPPADDGLLLVGGGGDNDKAQLLDGNGGGGGRGGSGNELQSDLRRRRDDEFQPVPGFKGSQTSFFHGGR
ncbi:hypothetical protein F4778DRAFT_194539 [Xylariomycetidae sp. FL2044]|nr:hypothetical protein F4778DRAFT_194539 [Xylariomycetidae sp. FL2044]